MKDFTSKIPTPITSLALGWVILGNVFQGVNTFLSDLCMVASLILIVLTFASLLLNPRKIIESFKTSVGMSLFTSITMALMMISIWMKGVFGQANIYIWVVGVILHSIILVIFTIRYVVNFNLNNVTPSWFLVYTGLGIGAITCRDFGMIVFGKATLSFIIFVSVVLAIPILISIFVKRQKVKNAYKPLFSLISVPLGIIIPAYIFVSEKVSSSTVLWMTILLQIIFVVVLINSLLQVFNGFYPGWSCYTVSSAITLYATSVANDLFISKKLNYVFFQYLLDVEYVVVFIICSIVLLAYLINVLDDPSTEGTHLNLTNSNHNSAAINRFSLSDLFSSNNKAKERKLSREKRRNSTSDSEKNDKPEKKDVRSRSSRKIRETSNRELENQVNKKEKKVFDEEEMDKFSNLID